jgi:hypothetical protein
MSRIWSALRHRFLGVCDWDGCRCRICRKTRDGGHDWDGCKCRNCPRARHEWDGCHCRRCDAEKHEWKGLACLTCGLQKDIRALLESHFAKEGQAIEHLLERLASIDLDWTTVYDWQLVELAREAIDCHRHNATYELEVPSGPVPVNNGRSSPQTGDSATSSDFVVATSLLLRRHDAPSRLIH